MIPLNLPAAPVRATLAGQSAEERREAMSIAMECLGFDALALMPAESMDSVLMPVSTLGALPDSSWPDLYLRAKHHEVDPRLHEVSGSGLPCVWNIQGLREDTLRGLPCERAERFVADLRRAGACSGLLFATRGGPGANRCLVDFRSTREGSGWITDAVIGQALLLGLFALEHGEDMAVYTADRNATDCLSELQRGILHCLRLGMGDKVIADRLGLSTHNVDYHLRKLRQRFGVRNRVQLVQAAQNERLMNRVAA